MLHVVGFGVTALILSYLGVHCIRRWAERNLVLDIPNERSSHVQPTPRGGGLAIVLVTLLGLIAAWAHDPMCSRSELLAYGIGAVLTAAVGWLEDVRSVPIHWRFIVQGLAALLAIFGLGYWHTVNVPLLGSLELGWFGFLVTFLWVVGLTNAYNFMDGIDGIAAGQAVVAGAAWAWLGWHAGLPLIGSVGMLLAVSSLGFLGHNWSPARIFMGDVGSTFLGYTFAVLTLVAVRRDPNFAFVGVLLVGPFIFDTVFTVLQRLRAGENILAAHRSHLYQRLIMAGYQHRCVTLLYMGLTLVTTSLTLLWLRQSSWADVLILPTLSIVGFALWRFVLAQERRRALSDLVANTTESSLS